MKTIISFLIIATFVSANSNFNIQLQVDIKLKTSQWTPEINKYSNLSFEEQTKLIGNSSFGDMSNVSTQPPTMTTNQLPVNFDWRKQTPNCVHRIRDQGTCGSCWAFSTSEILSDRFCIWSKGQTSPEISPQDLVSCDKNNGGCGGGALSNAWNFLEIYGAVNESCFPYASYNFTIEEKCRRNCVNGEDWKVYKAQNFHQFTSWTTMKTEIMTSGPVGTCFQIYEDFMTYKSGIYEHVSGKLVGSHCVKILGWGNENGVDYWTAANSFGTDWGEEGFFQIKMGQCYIDIVMMTGDPVLNTTMVQQ